MTQLEEKRQPAPRQRGSGGSRSGGGGGGSPRNLKPVKEDPSPISTSAQHKAVRSQDVLDALIDRLSIFGVLGVLVGITATAIGIMGQPGDWSRNLRSGAVRSHTKYFFQNARGAKRILERKKGTLSDSSF